MHILWKYLEVGSKEKTHVFHSYIVSLQWWFRQKTYQLTLTSLTSPTTVDTHYWTILKCQEKTLLFFTLEPKLLECALFVLFVIAKISTPLTFRRSDSWLDNSSTNDFDDVMLASWWNVCFILPLTSTWQGRYIDITGANITIIPEGNDLSTTVQHSSRDTARNVTIVCHLLALLLVQ